MTKILRDYIHEDAKKTGMTNAELVNFIIRYLDDKYDEEIDFAAEDLIDSGDIDNLITEATVAWIDSQRKK